MKKTLLASAVAAATFSGAVAAADMPTVYGNIQYVLTHTNVDGAGSEIDHADNGSTLGIKHSHEIAPGLTGFLKAEMEFDADDKSKSSGLSDLDEAYVGIESDSFGKIWIGSDDSTYERAIDIIYNFHELGSDIGGSYDTGEGDMIQYESPSFGGLKLGAAVQVNGDEKEGGKSYPYQLAAIYSVDALELAFAMDSNDGSLAYSKNNKPSPNNENTYGLRATYTMGNLSLTGDYQTRKDVADVYGIMGVYTLGANQFALSYQLNDDDETGDKNDTVVLQALHNLSDNMYVYFEGYLSNADADDEYKLEGGSGDEQTIAAVGAVYYF
ncbi:porin [Marinobacter lutaoensis]|uniref:porin n=1 Tax=Marinobacter lutaoensis TaxID=135739 RepID=UPI00159499E5|nr:porin [Marinobacter lutaoensis]NVD36761.1 porin [Marinobacter lutaoensis]